jgi:cysteine synthase
VFVEYHRTGNAELTSPGSRIEGIGRPRVEASFVRSVVDRMMVVDNADSVAAMRILSALLGRKVGPSTGTNFVGMLALAHEMRTQQQTGSIVSLLCDAGERYLPTYHDAAWVNENFGDCVAACARFQSMLS